MAPRKVRPQSDRLQYPLDARQVEALDGMLEELYKQAKLAGAVVGFSGDVDDLTDAKDITKTDDTNVTLTLGGTPVGSLIKAVSWTLGWTGLLAVARGGSGAGTLTGYLKGNGTSAFTASATIPAADVVGNDLTKTDDTNVTLTLGGTATGALLKAVSLTLGWAGSLAVARGGTGSTTASGARTNLAVVPGTDVFKQRTLTAGTGISITNGDGVSGDPVISGSGTPFMISLDVTDAQFRSLNTAPQQIIAGQGAAVTIEVVKWVVVTNISSGFSANPSINVRYTSGTSISGGAVTTASTTTGLRRYVAQPIPTSAVTGTTDVRNTGLEVFTSAAVTGGSTNGGHRVYVWYVLTTTP